MSSQNILDKSGGEEVSVRGEFVMQNQSRTAAAQGILMTYSPGARNRNGEASATPSGLAEARIPIPGGEAGAERAGRGCNPDPGCLSVAVPTAGADAGVLRSSPDSITDPRRRSFPPLWRGNLAFREGPTDLRPWFFI